MNEVNATPHAELIAELMDPNNPKNEREHAAVREIEHLQEALAQPERTWVGLTPENTFEIGERLGLSDIAWVDLMQAIEAKLKEKNNG